MREQSQPKFQNHKSVREAQKANLLEILHSPGCFRLGNYLKIFVCISVSAHMCSLALKDIDSALALCYPTHVCY